MHATSSDRCGSAGFTIIELVAVLALTALVSLAVLPRLDAISSMRAAGWREQVLAALRHAQSTAQSHRRLVCVNVATGAVTLTLATTNPATSCPAALPGPDAQAAWARDGAAPSTTVAPAGVLYVQPTGRVTTAAAADSTAVDRVISIAGEASITVVGETGHAH
ncbi:MAG: type II secretion system protein [Rubrivivax sp.]